jgi:hypothetical protein
VRRTTPKAKFCYHNALSAAKGELRLRAANSVVVPCS